LNRWNSTLALAHRWYPSKLNTPDLIKTLFGNNIPTTHGALVDAASKRLFGRTLAAPHRNAIFKFLGVSAGTPVHNSQNNISPAIDYRLGDWVALLLDSPYHLYR